MHAAEHYLQAFHLLRPDFRKTLLMPAMKKPGLYFPHPEQGRLHAESRGLFLYLFMYLPEIPGTDPQRKILREGEQ